MSTTPQVPLGTPGGPTEEGPGADEFAERLFASALGALDVFSVYLGDRLGWYRSLATDGPASSAELATRTGTQERYAREWLEGQAVAGVLTVARGRAPSAEPTTPPERSPQGGPPSSGPPVTEASARRYALPPGPAEVLTDEHSLAYLAPLPRLFAAVGRTFDELLGAYRDGGGVSWGRLGPDAREAQADLNRPWFEHELAGALGRVPDLHAILSRPSARVADVGCGAGWSTVALARAYPQARFDGYDIDGPSVEMARANAEAAGVADRVAFHAADAAALPAVVPLDAAFAFECTHDMPRPVEVLSAVRRAVLPDGAVVVMDEAVAEEFTAPGDEVERLMYGFSQFVCLPDGLSSSPSVGTGTVMRPATLERYAFDAGFERVEVLPIEGFSFFRFYRLHH
ncbi:methyltransferase domain-containing protein [Oerskovia enterophila]|uniref:methyltransferase domain-containing protein n=1 Tax=Oerskovia enterophila TaxID=43678 RepID=UPI0033949CC0